MFKIETVSTIANHIIQVVDVNVNGSSIVFDTIEDATKAIIEFSKLDNGTFFDDVASVAVVPVLTVSN